MMEEIREQAYKYAVKNAFLHNGKASVGAVVGKIVALNKEIDLKKVMPLIQEVVGEVNSKGVGEIRDEYEKFEKEGYELKPREKEEGLPALDWAEKGKEKVVTRFAPNPNGPFHLGGARAAVISYEYAAKYKGKFLLRFDDTDPKVKKPIENAEQVFREDLEWLGCRVDDIYFASDRLEIYYKFLKKLLEKGAAYVCCCEPSEWKELIWQSEACPCRRKKGKEQLALFEKMLKHELREGEAVVRIKSDLKHKDPSVRDWWLARVVDKPEHPRVKGKYFVWPSYNFASGIDDHELGVTLIIRGQEHEQNETKQRFLYEYFKWKYPHAIYFGRVALEGCVLSTSKIKEGIEQGEYIGWDDPRLGTIRAFRRRGFCAEVLRNAIMEIGIKSSDTTIQWNALAAENKKLIEGKAEEIVFIQEPVQLTVDNAKEKEVVSCGKKVLLSAGQQRFIVDKKGLRGVKDGDVFRLREAYNVKVKSVDKLEVQTDYVGDTKIEHIAPWLLVGADVRVVMPESGAGDKLKVIEGIADERLLDKKVGELCYFDRFGFVRVDGKEAGKIVVWFTHK